MSTLEWDPSLETGHALVDEQHRSLFGLVAEVSDVSLTLDQVATASALQRLSDYVLVHFGAEEALMRQHGYPEEHAAEHAAEHRALTDRTRELVLAFRTDAAAAAVELASFLIEWLTHHIEESDRKLVRFLQAEAE